MKSTVLKKSTRIALILTLAISVSFQGTGTSHAKTFWKPGSWFASDVPGQKEKENAEKAAQKAAEVARRAEAAAVEAKRAAEIAAQKAAEAKTSSSTQASPAEAEEEVTEEKTETTPEPTKPVEKANKAKAGGWHMLNVFDKGEDVKPEAVEKTVTTDSMTDPVLQNQVALLETEKGNIAFELYPQDAPQTVANFVKLVNEGFYNKYNMKFHRVVPGFVIQTGDPTGTGAGGSKQTVPLEIKNKLSHNAKGVVAMARGFDPNSASSQFYITLSPQTSLDGKYAIFGRVISGIGILDKIEANDMLYGIRLVDANTITRDPVEKKGILGFLK